MSIQNSLILALQQPVNKTFDKSDEPNALKLTEKLFESFQNYLVGRGFAEPFFALLSCANDDNDVLFNFGFMC
jgi:hypothetical protein